MRVIAGSARRTQLKTLEGMDTRPTTDRIKETLFNMIAPYLYDSIFLDLFAGSGGIGIEALSRGAMEAVFVEKNPKAMACVKENLQKTHFERKGMTMQMDVMTALYKLEGEKQFDYIFMDPPYNHELEKSVQVIRKNLQHLFKGRHLFSLLCYASYSTHIIRYGQAKDKDTDKKKKRRKVRRRNAVPQIGRAHV